MSPYGLRITHLIAVHDPLPLMIALTREQQLEILAATGLLVSTLELPLEAVQDGGEALARLPLPGCLRRG